MRKRNVWSVGLFIVAAVLPSLVFARIDTPSEVTKKGQTGPNRIFVLDGSTVHNVGELQMHVGNWGNFGSWPGSGQSFSEAPSAQWPAGSGIEYLFVAGLWIGAMKGGVPAVSTAAYAVEFRPTQDPRDIMYRTAEGARRARAPSTSRDDDRDGRIDEDWLNGWDDDLDGLIDEDFAAVSKQMFSCQYTDDQPSATRFTRSTTRFISTFARRVTSGKKTASTISSAPTSGSPISAQQVLEDLYIGFFADGDAGNRDADNYWEDDATGSLPIPVLCTDLGPVSWTSRTRMTPTATRADTPGYFGIMFLGHTTDPNGRTAPRTRGHQHLRQLRGQPVVRGRRRPDQRFRALRTAFLEDHRARRPGAPRLPHADGGRAVQDTGARQHTGVSDRFRDRRTGDDGIDQQRRQRAADLRRRVVQPRRRPTDRRRRSRDPRTRPGRRNRGRHVQGRTHRRATCSADRTVWINNDCAEEELFQIACGYPAADSAKFMTGINGQETRCSGSSVRHRRRQTCVSTTRPATASSVYWDNFSETAAGRQDAQGTDFEGYRVWRADNWNRPSGTSSPTARPTNCGSCCSGTDVVNNFGEDTGLGPVPLRTAHRTSCRPSAEARHDRIDKQYIRSTPGRSPVPAGCDAPGVRHARPRSPRGRLGSRTRAGSTIATSTAPSTAAGRTSTP